jgi:hypothetical protein
MVGAGTDIVQTGNYPTKQEVYMTVILELSQISYNWILRVSWGCKSSSWLRRAKKQQKVYVTQTKK